ncbi:MAG: hypothetical protein F7C07_01370 [Desulfurococcales archaeon]|nr:hypothetical protein [Desulfurococcales archaeon]
MGWISGSSRGLLGVFLPFILLLVLLLGSAFQAVGVLALSGDDEEDELYDDGLFEEVAESAGSVALFLGVLANVAFVGYKWARLHVRIRGSYKRVLDVHIFLNFLLAGLAFYHGYALRDTAGPVEYASVAVIAVILLSGVLLRYAKNRHVKWFARHIHIQRALAVILLIVVAVHVLTIED